jgi:hypothetical protein
MKKALSKSQELVLQLINQLTHNEDERQDLWVAYLAGTPSDRLHNILPSLGVSQNIQDKFKSEIHDLLSSPLPQEFIDYLTETERVVVCLLMLGCDLGTISKYNGISEVRIRQIMVSLAQSNAWDKLWHSKELLTKTRNSD